MNSRSGSYNLQEYSSSKDNVTGLPGNFRKTREEFVWLSHQTSTSRGITNLRQSFMRAISSKKKKKKCINDKLFANRTQNLVSSTSNDCHLIQNGCCIDLAEQKEVWQPFPPQPTVQIFTKETNFHSNLATTYSTHTYTDVVMEAEMEVQDGMESGRSSSISTISSTGSVDEPANIVDNNNEEDEQEFQSEFDKIVDDEYLGNELKDVEILSPDKDSHSTVSTTSTTSSRAVSNTTQDEIANEVDEQVESSVNDRKSQFADDQLKGICPGDWHETQAAPQAPPRRFSGLKKILAESLEETSRVSAENDSVDFEENVNAKGDVVLEDKIQEVQCFRQNAEESKMPGWKNLDESKLTDSIMDADTTASTTNDFNSTQLTIDTSIGAGSSLTDDFQIIGDKNTSESGCSRSSNISAEIHSAIDTLDSAITRGSRSISVDSKESPRDHHQGHFVVVAIDFGTTFSGYAFSFTRDPKSIHMMRKWEGGDPGVINQKTPTTILLDPEGRFHSFGFSARDFFHDMDPEESKKWLYFEKFKMVLHHNADLNQDTTLIASNGTEISATKIFSSALRFFKQHALHELSDQAAIKILNEDVRWVITVPAIWKQPAKQFMRQAAYEAGIASSEYPDQLIIALEPEAASIYCRRLRMYQLVPETPKKRVLITPKKESLTPEPMNMDLVTDDITIEDEFSFSKYPVQLEKEEKLESLLRGTRYMVVDCGGGTIDITVHEMQKVEGKLKELHKATGGPYGSVGVDHEFEELLNELFGKEFLDIFRYKRPAGWVDLMIAFESRKRAASPYKDNPLNVSLPFSFIDFYKKHKGAQVECAVRKFGDPNIRWSSQGMLRLMPEAMRKLFQPTLENITKTIGDVLNHPDAKDLQYLFLVGGFAESAILQYQIKQEFGHILKVIIPQDMGLCILKGAVLFGLDPTIVTVRKSRLTYGVGVLNRYVEGKHPENKKVTRDDISWCTDVFDQFVTANQSVSLGDTVLRSYTPAKIGQKQCVINIYCSDREGVKFITDRGVRRCGTLCLDFSDAQYQPIPKRREIQARMLFGDTEIKVSALDVSSGKCVRAGVDFLNK